MYAYEDEWEQGPTQVFDCSYETKQLVAKSWATLSVRKSQDEYVNGPGIPFIDFLVAFQIKNWYNGKLGIIAVALLLLVDRGPEIVRPAESTHRYSIPPQAYPSLAGTSRTEFLIYSLSCPGSHHCQCCHSRKHCDTINESPQDQHKSKTHPNNPCSIRTPSPHPTINPKWPRRIRKVLTLKISR